MTLTFYNHFQQLRVLQHIKTYEHVSKLKVKICFLKLQGEPTYEVKCRFSFKTQQNNSTVYTDHSVNCEAYRTGLG